MISFALYYAAKGTFTEACIRKKIESYEWIRGDHARWALERGARIEEQPCRDREDYIEVVWSLVIDDEKLAVEYRLAFDVYMDVIDAEEGFV